VIALGIAVVESLVWQPTFSFRSIIQILPFLYIGIGAAFTLPLGRMGAAAGMLIAVILVQSASQAPNPVAWSKDQWGEAATIAVGDVRAGLPANRVAVVEAPWQDRTDWILALNLAVGRRAPASDLPAELRGLVWIAGPDGLQGMPADQRLLLVAFHYWSPVRHAAIVAAAMARFGPCEDSHLSGITVLRCGPSVAP
jgi:hypothetical protein